MTEQTQTGADVLASRLAAAGCRRAFGMPGGEVLALVEALDRVGIEFILTKHENCAGFMAEGAWHTDGAPPVLIATLGPGVANAVNVVANALQDRVPLLFLTGCVDEAEAHSYTHQVFDHQALLAPIVKGSFKAQAGAVGLVIEKALRLANEGQAGPVHVDVPIRVAENLSEEPSGQQLSPVLGSGLGQRAAAEDAVFMAAATALSQAQQPVVITGVDAVNQGAGEAISAFCRRHQIPVISTYKAKGLLDERDPLALGGVGLSPLADQVVLPYLAESDCLLLLGYDPIEMRAGWRQPWSTDKTVIEISHVTRLHGMHWVSHTLQGDIAPTLKSLDTQVSRAPSAAQKTSTQGARQALAERYVAEPEFGPARVFHTLRAQLPENTVATTDSGAHRILFSQIWQCYHPRGLLQSSALCTMGCAVPLAAGVALADAKTPVVAVVGDAGLEMVLGELATLRNHRLPVLIVVMVDESLALIELKQRGSQRKNLGVDFEGSDLPAVAEALGGVGVKVRDQQQLEAAIAPALARNTFTLLACQISRKAYDGKL